MPGLAGQSPNYRGMKIVTGRADLGGGTGAVFRLESDFDIENGMAGPSGRLSGRRTYVGLLNEHWSMFATGRQSNAMQKTLVPLYIATALGRDVHHPFDTDDLDSTFLTNNSIQYQTPDWVACARSRRTASRTRRCSL
ncbi:porin [Burkholderia pseudomallei]|uniref:porin n=2 Tax=Burkholderia pseudomallei TaxID=28450 RepID=UPI000F04D9FE|nr:porin [Burkholderia pseudomallei]MCW0072748.1 porin [Burkholderia pseudomallei]VBH20114.1 outer membrane porin [Burkholderia pseudomallei]